MITLSIYKIIANFFRPFFFIFFLGRLLRNKEEKGNFSERRGFCKIKRPQGKLIWIHAASVGETLSAIPLIDELIKLAPDYNILLTTGTKTSKDILSKRGIKGVIHQYLPWDVKSYCVRFLSHWNPDISVFIESEIWPNILIETQRKRIPIALVNARITKKSEAKWSNFKKTIKYLLSIFSIIISQDNLSKKRLENLGGKNILMLGNLKHDSKSLPLNKEIFYEFEKNFINKIMLVAASTHPGEEGGILKTFKNLLSTRPNLFLVLAPRHPDRRDNIIGRIKAEGFSDCDFILRSNSLVIKDGIKILILDSIGELGYFYEKASYVVLGGSFENIGGHNPIEAARLNNAIFTGPYFYNFKEEYNGLIECGGAKVINSYDDLKAIKNLSLIKSMALESKNYANSLGGAAVKVATKIIGLKNENK